MPQVMILPPGNLDMTLRHILDHSHSDLQISRMSSWRFAWPAGVGPYVTTYPCHDDIVRDLQDDRSGQKRPFAPNYLISKGSRPCSFQAGGLVSSYCVRGATNIANAAPILGMVALWIENGSARLTQSANLGPIICE